MALNFASLKLSSPFMTASGCSGYGWELNNLFPKVNYGAVTTKTITYKERKGNPPPRIFEIEGGVINRVGLENCGVFKFIDEHLPKLKKSGVNFIVSIYGENLEEWVEILKLLKGRGVKFFELNLSCPNLKNRIVQEDVGYVRRVVRSLRKFRGVKLIAKINAIHSPIELTKKLIEDGIDGIVCSNTFPCSFIFNGKIYDGGVSGRVIKPVVLKVVKELRKRFRIPLAACGGIYSKEDVDDYRKVGVDFFVLGSILLREPDIGKWLK
ncbi:MAG: hypothetical protein DRI36_03060 [Caldiserica bacterium]|nr:MAG: hypothetical protein DRI36_03060 [Caldisericota bacterium]